MKFFLWFPRRDDVLAVYTNLQVLENADTHFSVGCGHWVTVTGRSKDDFDLTIAGLWLNRELHN